MKGVVVEAGEVPAKRCAPDLTVSSFDAFFASEYPRIVRIAFALTGRRDIAEDEAQESLMAVHRNWDKVSAYGDPAAWLRRVVINRCTSIARRRVTEARLLVRLRSERAVDVTLPAPDDALWAAVRALPRRQRQVVTLRFVEDRSIADIAAILGCDQQTVRTHLRRGRLAVAAALELNEENHDDTR